jgi:hypothetical protein
MTKEEIVNELAMSIGMSPPKMSTGSTEPREIFDMIDDVLGLRLNTTGRNKKQDVARGIVQAAGHSWNPEYESRGGTVTKQGLLAVARAVSFLMK